MDRELYGLIRRYVPYLGGAAHWELVRKVQPQQVILRSKLVELAGSRDLRVRTVKELKFELRRRLEVSHPSVSRVVAATSPVAMPVVPDAPNIDV